MERRTGLAVLLLPQRNSLQAANGICCLTTNNGQHDDQEDVADRQGVLWGWPCPWVGSTALQLEHLRHETSICQCQREFFSSEGQHSLWRGDWRAGDALVFRL